MKKAALAALIAVFVMALSPVCVDCHPAANGASLIALDLCHADGHFYSANQPIQFVCQNPFLFHAAQTESSFSWPGKLMAPFLTAADKDRPPIV